MSPRVLQCRSLQNEQPLAAAPIKDSRCVPSSRASSCHAPSPRVHFVTNTSCYGAQSHLSLNPVPSCALLSCLSQLVLSYSIISHLILSHFFSSYLFFSYLIVAFLILSYHISSYLLLSHPVSTFSHLVLSYLISSSFVAPYLISSYLILSHLILAYLSYLFFSFSIFACLISSHLVSSHLLLSHLISELIFCPRILLSLIRSPLLILLARSLLPSSLSHPILLRGRVGGWGMAVLPEISGKASAAGGRGPWFSVRSQGKRTRTPLPLKNDLRQ